MNIACFLSKHGYGRCATHYKLDSLPSQCSLHCSVHNGVAVVNYCFVVEYSVIYKFSRHLRQKLAKFKTCLYKLRDLLSILNLFFIVKVHHGMIGITDIRLELQKNTSTPISIAQRGFQYPWCTYIHSYRSTYVSNSMK